MLDGPHGSHTIVELVSWNFPASHQRFRLYLICSLRGCFLLFCAVSRPNYILRVLHPDTTREFATLHDAANAVRGDIWMMGRSEVECRQFLPLSLGGLSFRSQRREKTTEWFYLHGRCCTLTDERCLMGQWAQWGTASSGRHTNAGWRSPVPETVCGDGANVAECWSTDGIECSFGVGLTDGFPHSRTLLGGGQGRRGDGRTGRNARREEGKPQTAKEQDAETPGCGTCCKKLWDNR